MHRKHSIQLFGARSDTKEEPLIPKTPRDPKALKHYLKIFREKLDDLLDNRHRPGADKKLDDLHKELLDRGFKNKIKFQNKNFSKEDADEFDAFKNEIATYRQKRIADTQAAIQQYEDILAEISPAKSASAVKKR